MNNALSLTKDTQAWLNKLKPMPQLDIALLTKACQLAEQCKDLGSIPYGENSLVHGLNIAEQLLELECDSTTLAAAILYPCVHYHNLAAEKINNEFGKTIYKIITGTIRMEAIQNIKGHDAEIQSDNLRKMLLAIVDDIRIVLVKLAERLATLKAIKNCPPIQKQQVARSAMHLYAPLANRLGIGQFKWQIEDYAFRYLNPEDYIKISKALNMRRQERETFIEEMMNELAQMITEVNIEGAEITGRAKHIYSIHKKIERKHVDFSEIYDTSAVRVLVKSIKDCYTVLSLVHAKWQHIAKEFDDYIAKPKPNGYRSIHTAVVGPKNINVEIQIRTFKMHEESELGVAAHWKYKEGRAEESTYEDKINLLREVMDWQKEVSEEENEPALYSKIFEDRIYVFTPKGDVFDLEAGATPLDFAYHIHTDVGHRCRGAKVNGRLIPLTHQLKTGDQVEILTSKTSNPSRDWLNPKEGYLNTHAARNKVRHWFKKETYQENLTHGQDVWDKAFRREGIPRNTIEKVYKIFNFKSTQDLLVSLGAGDISVAAILQKVKKPGAEKIAPQAITAVPTKAQTQSASSLIIEGVGNLLTQIARCCRPIPGDSIIGYITKGHGISIHQKSCPNIAQAIQYRPQRILEVSWGSAQKQAYPVDLRIEAEDRPGLVRDISNIIAGEHITLLGLQTRVNKIKNEAYISATIEIDSLEPLNKILNQIRQVPGIIRVLRR